MYLPSIFNPTKRVIVLKAYVTLPLNLEQKSQSAAVGGMANRCNPNIE